jgi:hypothetical protein
VTRALVLCLCAAGCGTDLFALPYDRLLDLGFGGADLAAGDGSFDLLDEDGSGFGDGGGDLAGVDLTGGGVLPASCAQLGCTPTVNEGEVSLDSGEVSGCHAYDRLTISGVVLVGKSDGQGFAACANRIVLGISLSADGRGFSGASGPGMGGSCGSGGGHGGKGADATGCNGGGTYDDPNLPRLPGSGGGSFGGGGGGGAGGGAIELVADEVDVIGFVTANGAQGTSVAAGGGAGGSILIRAGQLIGTGSVRAQGGGGLGLGGGGGGGRVAVFAGTNAASLNFDVGGGDSMNGSPGAPGTLIQP